MLDTYSFIRVKQKNKLMVYSGELFMWKCIYIFLLLFIFNSELKSSFSSSLSSFTSTMSGIGNGFKNFGEGMAQSFGMSPPGYHYSFEVFNNTIADTVSVQCNDLDKIQGVVFEGSGTSGSTVSALLPGQSTGSNFSNIGLYLEVEIGFGNGKGSFTDDLVNAMPTYADATNGLSNPTFYYNVYTKVDTLSGVRQVVGPAVEKIGQSGPNANTASNPASNGSYVGFTSDFNALIYNGVNQQNTIVFSCSDPTAPIGTPIKKYTVTLDPNSFNFLTSDSTHAFRLATGVSTLVFSSAGTLPMSTTQNTVYLNPQGLATASWSSTANAVVTNSVGNGAMRCNYEIISNNATSPVLEVIQTGFNPGNYLVASTSSGSAGAWSIIPVSKQTRDLSPVRCFIWNQSAAQYVAQLAAQGGIIGNATTEVSTSGSTGSATGAPFVSFDPVNRSLWFIYYAPGWLTASSPDGVVLGQIPTGQAVSFSFIRPPLNYKCTLSPAEAALCTIPAPTTTPSTIMPLTTSLISAARLSIVSLDTTNPTTAQQFLRNLASEKIKFIPFIPPTPPATVPTMSYAQQSSLLSQPLTNNLTYLTDPDSGVTGILLASDVFSSYEGSSGPFYYTIYPPQACFELPLQMVGSCVNNSVFATAADGTNPGYATLMNNVQLWVSAALNPPTPLSSPATPQSVALASVSSYLQGSGIGINNIFMPVSPSTNPVTYTTNFNTFGQSIVQRIVNGPGSITDPLIFWMAGTNDYVFSGTSSPTMYESSNGEIVTNNANNPNCPVGQTCPVSVSTWAPSAVVPIG